MASIELYRRTNAAVLVQSYARRGLSVIEASERRRLRNQQVEVAAGFCKKPAIRDRITRNLVEMACLFVFWTLAEWQTELNVRQCQPFMG